MRYRSRVTAPAAALIGTAAALTAAPSALAAPTHTGTSAARTSGTPGPETLGDPVFPDLGNDGYRVAAYHLDFSYDATTRLVDATATLKIRTTQALTRFSLDALGLDIRAVRVGGRTATYEQVAEKLRITPARTLPAKSSVTVCVEYSADPGRDLPHTGWVATPDGFAAFPQPNSAHTVFPCNDHPSDKADFSFRLTVPGGVRGVATGLLVRTESLSGGRTAYTYRSREPIATELVQITVGDYVVKERQGPHGLPLRDVVPTARAAALEPALALTPGLVTWLEARLGAYPFETYGLLPCNTDVPEPFAFIGLETQTLTIYRPNYLLQEEKKIGSHMMHELVHSYFGNSVSPATWADLWLNEGHADFYGLLYRYERGWPDSLGMTTLEARMKNTYAQGDQWRHNWGPVAAPNAVNLFESQRYLGGVLVLYALRNLVGEQAFNALERAFLARYRNASASTEDYIAVASEVSGRDLSGFLRDWLYGTKTPRMPGHPDWTVTPVNPSLAAPHSRKGGHHHENSATL
ncbi:zinc metalloprotease [Streptomyces viridochromogenes]|uniref:Aminopeptidase N n=1 Tax=Streptomyces viridochromogenes TaxID=1938 RepID=A0A0J7ZLI8_STRVR|nr:M1 family metallopeptidase [Streptomyces viridochromogenes]KMS76292.1 zinc metalloprotease [Streptomyces viridochromogenes]KOG20404.1 zinc metalloprotease [Streptomyces viridochromogenes]KOG22247.1 zinc metalloprotease [Streptomyces viridochromogenes]